MKLLSTIAAATIAASALGAASAQQGTPPATPPAAAAPAAKAPEYVTIQMEQDVAKPAADVWAKVGKDYCALGKWIRAGGEIPCTVTKGAGEIGSVRSIANGAVTEVLTAKTDLSYGYTQPAKEGKFYDLYHGFLEAKPTGANSTKLIYTLMYDVSNLADQAAKDADVKRRRDQFTAALANMKALAEK